MDSMSAEVKWVLEEEDVDWDMTYDEDWQKKFGVPAVEKIFERDKAIALLLLNDVCFVGGFFEGPSTDAQPASILMLCSDTFAYACADFEPVMIGDVEALYRAFRKDPVWGPTAWAVGKRKQRPIKPVEDGLQKRGFDVDALIAANLS
jgi:hypothetical protein